MQAGLHPALPKRCSPAAFCMCAVVLRRALLALLWRWQPWLITLITGGEEGELCTLSGLHSLCGQLQVAADMVSVPATAVLSGREQLLSCNLQTAPGQLHLTLAAKLHASLLVHPVPGQQRCLLCACR